MRVEANFVPFRTEMQHGGTADNRAQPRIRTRFVGARQDKKKFVATPAGADIALADTFDDATGNLDDHRVTGRVAVIVVDRLEVVDIDQQ